jgi:predicted GNAT superfamily acetyltransferase
MTKPGPIVGVDNPVEIRRAETIADYRACQEAQRQAWGISDEGYLIPVATMVGANLHGGLVLGAFLSSGEAVAMSFAFLGRLGGRVCLYSQLTGVVPGYQSQGLGFEMKRVQRAIAHSEGLECIAWAFDPLQAGNAHFNLSRLRATAGVYIGNMYGLRTDALNAGVPTDRLIAKWDTASDRQPSALAATSRPYLIRIEQGDEGAQAAPLGLDMARLVDPCILLEIPADIARMRQNDSALAERWRVVVGHAFRAAFAAGYHAVDLIRQDSARGRRSFYVLERV